tara:strand:+ start:9445 stop:10281 length:837 start_codon:yes stop_codon:yes gene_type:complete
MLWKFLFGTTIGAFLLAIAAYLASPVFFLVEPFSPGELLNWFSHLPETYKVASLSAGLTVAGFMVAFHTATINWKNQLKAELKSQAAGEVEEFFSIVSGLISDAAIYVESLIEAINKLQKGGDPDEARFAVNWAIDGSEKFIGTRNQISQAQVQVHRLKGRNYTILSSGWGLAANLDQAIESMNEIGSRMWVHVPRVDKNDPDYIQHFHNLVNVEECKSFLEAANRFTGPMSMLAGSIKGYLLSPVMGFNWPMFAGLIVNRKEFTAAIKTFYEAMNDR